jgi:hypothetical protein
VLLAFNRPIGLEMKPAPKRSKEVVKRTVFDWLTACFETREVDPQEIDLVWPTHRNKWLRPEVEAKLKQLNLNDPIHRELHHLVSLSLDLFDAVDAGRYQPGKDWPEIEPRLKRALAYFVKSGDAIPDHEPTGFDDDHREFRDLAQRAELLLAHFEAHRRRSG